MLKVLDRYNAEAYALLRIVSGFLFAFHGLQIVFGLFSTGPAAFGSQFWIGGVIELLGGFAIMLGWQTRIAALISSGTMAVAYVQFHWHFQGGQGFFPAMNQGELSFLNCFVFLFIATQGPGKWALSKKG